MSAQKVLPDATALFSRTTRDWLFLLRNHARGDFYVVGYTEDILAETIAKLRDRNPDWSGGQTTRIHDRIVENADFRIDDFPGDIVYAGLDEGDRHVHAAAASSGIDILVTDDLGFVRMRDALELDALPYEVMSADDFFILIDDSQPALVLEAVRDQVAYYNKVGRPANLVASLQAAGCPEFAERVRRHLRTLSGVGGVVRKR